MKKLLITLFLLISTYVSGAQPYDFVVVPHGVDPATYFSSGIIIDGTNVTGAVVWTNASGSVGMTPTFTSVTASNFYSLSSVFSMGLDGLTNMGIEVAGVPTTGQTNSLWIGYGAGSNSGGAYNNYIGWMAGNTSRGNQNTAVGHQALMTAAGLQNTAIGLAAGQISAGNLNVAVGYAAHHTSAGNYDTAVGGSAVRLSAGGYNTGVGYQSLYSSPGLYNAAVGMYASKDAAGSYNTAIGYAAGYLCRGLTNIFIGNYAGYQDTTVTNYVTNCIVIGGSVKVKGNDTIALGSSKHTTYIDGALVVSNGIRSAGSVAIGTANPTLSLTMQNGANQVLPLSYVLTNSSGFQSYAAQNYPSANAFNRVLDIVCGGDGGSGAGGHIRFLTAAGTGTAVERMIIDKLGNVGIGTNAPAAGNMLEIYNPTGCLVKITAPQAPYMTGIDLAPGGGRQGGIRANGTTGEIQHYAGVNYYHTFYANAVEVMRISTAGIISGCGSGLTNLPESVSATIMNAVSGLGYTLTDWNGPVYRVACSDTDAQVEAGFYVRKAGSFKICIVSSCDSANTSKTVGGAIYAGTAAASGGGASWNIFSGTAMNISLNNSMNVMTVTTTAAFTVVDDAYVSCVHVKNDNAGGAAGFFDVRAIVLLRQ